MTGFRFPEGAASARRFDVVRVLKDSGDGAALLVRDRAERGAARFLKIAQGRDAATSPRAARLENEHRVLSALRHPGVPAALDFGRDVAGDFTWLLLEAIGGRALSERGRLAPSQAALLFAEYLRVLACVHDEGFVHCDVKPDNLLRDDAAARCVLGDFDLAGPVRGVAGRGTPPFVAPEILRRRDADGRADLWSLAASFLALLGRPLPDEEGALPAGAADDLGALGPAIEACLRVDPADRPADARAAFAILRAAGADAPDETPLTARARLERPPLVGDDAARRQVLAEIPPGRPRIGGAAAVTLVGPFGSGRTRLLERLSAEWRAADVRVVAASPADGGRARAVGDLLRRLGDDTGAAREAELLRSPGGAERLAARLFEAARARRTVLTLDDVDAFDRATRDVLARFLRRLADETAAGDGAIVQAVLAVDPAREPDDGLAAVAASESDAGAVVAVRLEPLPPAEVDRLARTLARRVGVDPERASAFALRAAG
ncbi:MAG TPA: AAA family ATPase, partial [Planctomycetota bacterium]|nr:AAA family ATPase [Planctomycetota bacterium]